MTAKERRIASNEAFGDLRNRIGEGLSEAIREGLIPTELWLGPTEARVLEVELNWQLDEGSVRPTNNNLRAAIHGDVEGLEFFGLCVRVMVKDGVRVGISR